MYLGTHTSAAALYHFTVNHDCQVFYSRNTLNISIQCMGFFDITLLISSVIYVVIFNVTYDFYFTHVPCQIKSLYLRTSNTKAIVVNNMCRSRRETRNTDAKAIYCSRQDHYYYCIKNEAIGIYRGSIRSDD
ncbi:hypothetical protein K449DRAFT_197150 [Hypoxylon sp. EC38]|nr:hypothetical protein K449DRAFT_197150 [Hypoxylon sp. EC38]